MAKEQPKDEDSSSDLAEDILDAIRSKDAEALADALREFVYDCNDDEPGLKIKIGG